MPVNRPVANVRPAEVVATPSRETPESLPNLESDRDHLPLLSLKISVEVWTTEGPWIVPTAQPPLPFAVTA